MGWWCRMVWKHHYIRLVFKKIKVHSTWIIKNNNFLFPVEVISEIIKAGQKKPMGHSVVTRTKILYIPIFACACDWSQNPSIIFYSTTGDTYRSLHLYRSQFEDDFACVGCREIPKKRFRLHLLLSSLIDDHNKKFQNNMKLNKFCPTKNCWFRLLTNAVDMCVVGFHCPYLNSIKISATKIQEFNVRSFII